MDSTIVHHPTYKEVMEQSKREIEATLAANMDKCTTKMKTSLTTIKQKKTPVPGSEKRNIIRSNMPDSDQAFNKSSVNQSEPTATRAMEAKSKSLIGMPNDAKARAAQPNEELATTSAGQLAMENDESFFSSSEHSDDPLPPRPPLGIKFSRELTSESPHPKTPNHLNAITFGPPRRPSSRSTIICFKRSLLDDVNAEAPTPYKKPYLSATDNGLRKQVRDLNLQLQVKALEMAKLQDELEDANDTITLKNRTIKGQTTTVQESIEIGRVFTKQLETKEQLIKAKNNEIESNNARLEAKDVQIKEHSEAASSLRVRADDLERQHLAVGAMMTAAMVIQTAAMDILNVPDDDFPAELVIDKQDKLPTASVLMFILGKLGYRKESIANKDLNDWAMEWDRHESENAKKDAGMWMLGHFVPSKARMGTPL